jgi:hypothetical protein
LIPMPLLYQQRVSSTPTKILSLIWTALQFSLLDLTNTARVILAPNWRAATKIC